MHVMPRSDGEGVMYRFQMSPRTAAHLFAIAIAYSATTVFPAERRQRRRVYGQFVSLQF